jgi:hypothetical protein
MRLPVALKIALQSAGANGGTGGSPTPPVKPLLGTIAVWTTGAISVRRPTLPGLLPRSVQPILSSHTQYKPLAYGVVLSGGALK